MQIFSYMKNQLSVCQKRNLLKKKFNVVFILSKISMLKKIL